jgi:hypothetical protein
MIKSLMLVTACAYINPPEMWSPQRWIMPWSTPERWLVPDHPPPNYYETCAGVTFVRQEPY